MDVYLTSLALGGVGLVAMALSGTGRHGQHGSGTHGGAHSGHSGGHTGGRGHVHAGGQHAGAHASSHAANVQHGHDAPSAAHAHGPAQTMLALMSPRTLFSVCLGLGTTGLLLQNRLDGLVLFATAVVGGVLFERLIVTPIWNFTFRFASNPALTLESALLSEATAVTKFDANGQGIIAIEVDGQSVQLLGTLQPDDRALGAKVLAGARLRVEDVDAARNRCTVSLL